MTANVARVLAFLALFTGLTLAWANPSAAPLQAWVIERLTVQPAAWLFGLIDAGRGVEAAGARLTSPAGNVQVLPGWHSPAYELYALWHPGKPVAPRLTAFIEFLSEVLSGPIAAALPREAGRRRRVLRRTGASRKMTNG